MSQFHPYENDVTRIVATPAEEDSTATINCGSSGSIQPSMMVDYALNTSESILLMVGAEGNPELLFPMDADEFFNSPF